MERTGMAWLGLAWHMAWTRLNYITAVWEYINGISKLVYIFHMESVCKRLIFICSVVRACRYVCLWTIQMDAQANTIGHSNLLFVCVFILFGRKMSIQNNRSFDLSQMN